MLKKLYQNCIITFLTIGLILFQKSRKAVFFILWPLTKYTLSSAYVRVIDIGNSARMYVYGSVVDMVNKTLLFYSRFRKFAWEPRTSRVFLSLLKPESSVVVAGGHIGYYALLAGSVAKKGRIDVFEPVPDIYQKLTDNIKLNGFENVTAVHGALSNNNDGVTIISDHAQSSILESSHNKELDKYRVASYSLDSYCSTRAIMPTTILLDVEGYELFVFEGAAAVLEKSPDIIFEVNAKMLRAAGTQPDSIFEFLSTRGYQLFLIEDEYDMPSLKKIESIHLYRLRNLSPKNIGSFFNVLATKNILQVQNNSRLPIITTECEN